MSYTPSGHDTLESVTFSDTNNVKNIVLTEDVIDSDFLLEESLDERNFVSNGLSSVNLDFEDVVLLLSQVLKEVVLSMDDSSNWGSVFSDSVEFNFQFLGLFGNSWLVAGESFLLGVNPVLVESSEGSLVEVVSPDSGKSSQSSWGFNVSNQTNNF